MSAHWSLKKLGNPTPFFSFPLEQVRQPRSGAIASYTPSHLSGTPGIESQQLRFGTSGTRDAERESLWRRWSNDPEDEASVG